MTAIGIVLCVVGLISAVACSINGNESEVIGFMVAFVFVTGLMLTFCGLIVAIWRYLP